MGFEPEHDERAVHSDAFHRDLGIIAAALVIHGFEVAATSEWRGVDPHRVFLADSHSQRAVGGYNTVCSAAELEHAGLHDIAVVHLGGRTAPTPTLANLRVQIGVDRA